MNSLLHSLTVKNYVELGKKFTLLIFYEWPFMGSPIIDPIFASQIIAKLSLPVVTMRLLSG